MKLQRSVSVGILALSVALLTACAGLPIAGPVNEGLPPGELAGSLGVDFLPERPIAGATPEQIVEGFVEAATSPAGNFEIARSFLASSVRDEWDPSAGVTIDQPRSRSFSPVVGGTVTLTLAPATASTFHYRLRPIARGDATFEGVQLRLHSALRLWKQSRIAGPPQRVRVYPNFAPLTKFALFSAEQASRLVGAHLKRRRGEGTDFNQMREYRIGPRRDTLGALLSLVERLTDLRLQAKARARD